MSSWRAIISLFLGLFVSVSIVGQNDSLANEGVQSFLMNGKYQRVIDSLSPSISKANSFSSFYNLGIAYEKTGSHIKALWCFENALKIDPSASNAQHNASFVYSKINGGKAWDHPYSWVDRLLIAFESVWAPLLVIAVLLLGLVVFLKISRTRVAAMNWIKRTWLLWLLLVMVSLFGINKVNHHYNTHRKAIIEDQNLTTYVSPEGVVTNDKVKLPTRFTIKGYNEDSTFISFKMNDEVLWIDSKDALVY